MAIPAGGYEYEADAAADGVLHYYPCYDDQYDALGDDVVDIVGAEGLQVYGTLPENTLVTDATLGFGLARDLTANGQNVKHNWLQHEPDVLNTTTLYDWTIAIWFKPKTLNTVDLPTVIDCIDAEGFKVYFDFPGSVDTLYIDWGNGNILTMSTTTMPTINGKNLLLLSSDFTAGSVSAYLNDTLIATDTNGYQPLRLYDAQWFVGCDSGTELESTYFDAVVDELAVFDHPLDATDRATYWNLGAGIELVKWANSHRVLVGDGLGMSAASSWSWGVVAAETFGLDDAQTQALLKQLAAGSDVFGLSDATTLQIVFKPTAEDGVAFADAVSQNMRLPASAADGMSFVASMNVSGESYVGVAMNTELLGVTEYLNYGFDSMAHTGRNTFVGAKADGLYELDGSDDAGTQIDASLKTKMYDFSSPLFKRVERAYLGLKNSEPMVLKVITRRDSDGVLVENWYKLTQTGDNFRQERIKLGKGLKSHYYQFELLNTVGGSFELDQTEFVPIILTRRV